MNAMQNIVLVLIMLGFAGAEYASRRYRDFNATKDDGKLELFMFISLLAIIQPVIFAITGKAAALWIRNTATRWPGCPGGQCSRSCWSATTWRSTGGTAFRTRQCCGHCTVPTTRPTT